MSQVGELQPSALHGFSTVFLLQPIQQSLEYSQYLAIAHVEGEHLTLSEKMKPSPNFLAQALLHGTAEIPAGWLAYTRNTVSKWFFRKHVVLSTPTTSCP